MARLVVAGLRCASGGTAAWPAGASGSISGIGDVHASVWLRVGMTDAANGVWDLSLAERTVVGMFNVMTIRLLMPIMSMR